MRTVYLTICVSFLFCLGIFYYFGRATHSDEVVAQTSYEPNVRNIRLKTIYESNVDSVVILSKRELVGVSFTNPNIFLLNFDSEKVIQLSSIYKRESWTLSDFDFIDPLNGFAAGNHGTFLSTNDGGITWNELKSFTYLNLSHIKFLNQSVGYAASRYGKINNETQNIEWKIEIWKTEDGGKNWLNSYHSDKDYEVFQIAILSADIALASLNGNRLIRTSDGGKTWDSIKYNGKSVTSVSISPDGKCWLVGAKGEFFVSDDFGKTWDEPNNFASDLHNYKWCSIDFDETGNGLAVSEDGIIVYTNDGGQSWKKITKKENDTLRSVEAQDGIGVVLGSTYMYKIEF
jgi:photosystem II stability/assembly factor-like uncharacterized protein